MTRTDVHRPSAEGFDPENYDCLIVTDLNPGPEFDDGGRRVRIEIVNRMLAQGYRFDPQYNHGQCTHCGAYIRYEALMAYAPGKTLVSVGEQCLGNRFETSAEQFATLRAAAAAQARATREANARNATKAAVLEWLAETDEPLLVELSYRGNGGIVDASPDFLADVADKLFRYGNLSERQVAAVLAVMRRDMNRQGHADQRVKDDAARQASAKPAPLGKVTVSGTVEHTWMKDNGYTLATKMRVRHADGWVVIATVPASIMREIEDRTELHGQKIEFSATLGLATWESDTPDPTVAFAQRPTKARLLG